MTERRPSQASAELDKFISEDRDQFDALCQFTPRVSDAMAAHPMMRYLVPAEFGGDESGLLAWFRASLAIATVDASAGWVAAQNAAANCIVGSVAEPSFAKRLFADPRANTATSVRGNARLRRIDDSNVEVDGSWQFVSGATIATYLGGIVIPEEGALESRPGFPFVLVEASQAEIVRNWDPIGLRGTGSHDVVVRRLVVPRDQVMWYFGGERAHQWHRYSPIGTSQLLITLSAAAVQLGVARHALDLGRQTLLTRSQLPLVDAPLIDEPTLLNQLAAAEGEWVLAYGGMEAAVSRLDDALISNTAIREAKLNARIAGVTAVHRCAAIVASAYDLGGTEASVRGSGLERCFRDANVLTSHVVARKRALPQIMRILLGRSSHLDEFGL